MVALQYDAGRSDGADMNPVPRDLDVQRAGAIDRATLVDDFLDFANAGRRCLQPVAGQDNSGRVGE